MAAPLASATDVSRNNDVVELVPLEVEVLGFRCTGMLPEDKRIDRATGLENIVDLAQKDRCRWCGMVTAI
jgi:hypothetical protein